ncbi:SMP-30/gluconolactonase/LRE family protein [Herbiconiux sp. P16]|uniref:SMP-30/gluconolactonase/LRE family protein n=1 Tax=Herbiconiux wuyangfengii TaxID=3342794 RepID=UPI0035BB9BDE
MAGSDGPVAVVQHPGGRWLGAPAAFHGEGAFWDAAIGALRSVDMLRGDVLTHREPGAADPGAAPAGGGDPVGDPAGGGERMRVGDVAALIRRRGAGGYVVATERGFALLDDDLGLEREIPVFGDPGVRLNEGACDAAGRFYCGSMAYDCAPGAGKLYRLDPDLSVHVALEHVTIPNGLVWTDGGTVALHADTADDAVYAYEFDPVAGTFGERAVFVDFAGVPGSPDGMALDVEGGLWVAMWGGGAVRRYDARGILTDVVPLPVTNPTSCAIGGQAGTTLFVTTSRQGLVDRVEPHAGQVYAIDIGLAAAEVHAFG